MRRLIAAGGAALALALGLSGCASPQDKTNDACADVKDVVNALPEVAGDDGAKEIVPRLDRQIDAAAKADQAFGDAGADAAFRAAWQHLNATLRDDRKAWQDPLTGTGAPPGPGSDMVIAMNLAGFKAAVDGARTDLGAAATKAGYPGCGDAITWRY
ncbi:hypothetical protein ABZU76_29630 [Amycolatopsis sp. NPDC005232]|uniref:hypothetical protein n=1 Tax=Amycolatopsis sp. NPDC005232 TaxID=3157027 RepID=UPI0033BE1989